jgi:hypothetical protein
VRAKWGGAVPHALSDEGLHGEKLAYDFRQDGQYLGLDSVDSCPADLEKAIRLRHRLLSNSIMLIAIPAVALSMAIMSMRNTTYSIQTSVYVVYLGQRGLVGTTIGILFAAAEIASGFGALFAGRAMRLGDAQRTMLATRSGTC